MIPKTLAQNWYNKYCSDPQEPSKSFATNFTHDKISS